MTIKPITAPTTTPIGQPAAPTSAPMIAPLIRRRRHAADQHVDKPIATISGGPTHTAMSDTRAAGRPPTSTVRQPGPETGPLLAGQVHVRQSRRWLAHGHSFVRGRQASCHRSQPRNGRPSHISNGGQCRRTMRPRDRHNFLRPTVKPFSGLTNFFSLDCHPPRCRHRRVDSRRKSARQVSQIIRRRTTACPQIFHMILSARP